MVAKDHVASPCSQRANGRVWLGGVVQWCGVHVLAKQNGSAWLIAAGGIIVLPGVLCRCRRGMQGEWGSRGSIYADAGSVPNLFHLPSSLHAI